MIDRANASADKTNANEMTNAIERFASEYELYCQDIASGVIADTDGNGTPDNLDAAQGRVYNVTKAFTRDDIEELEVSEETPVDDEAIAIYRDTKYPANAKTMQAIVENYTKTSSATFTPKQSDMHYWYSPDCGVVVIAKKNASTADLNKLVVSGMDAKGNELDGSVVWIDMTDDASLGAGDAYNANIIPTGGVYTSNGVQYTAGETFPTPQPGDSYTYGDYSYFYCSIIGGEGYEVPSGFEVAARDRTKTHYDNILASVNGIPVTSVG